MMLAWEKIIPPKEWLHDPKLQNDYRETVATLLTDRHITIPK